MATSIIGQISEEIKELGRDTGKAVVKEVAQTGADFFKAILNMDPGSKMTAEQLTKKKAEDEAEKQANLAKQRKALKELMLAKQQPQESAFERVKQEEQWKKQRQVELVKQKQMQPLQQMSSKPQRGNLFAVKRRKQNQVEMQKLPGQ